MRETEYRWGRCPVKGNVGSEETLGDEAVSRRSSAKPQGFRHHLPARVWTWLWGFVPGSSH